MKRGFADNDLRQPPPCSACCAKRRKTQCAPAVPPRTSSPPPFDPAPQTLALVDTPLLSTQQHNLKDVARSIQSWVEDCAATSSPEVMAAPPTPRSYAINERGRRSGRRYARSYGSRTPSPSKKPSPQTYRTRNMYHAGVFVDNLGELPPVVDVEIRRILGVESWESQVTAPLSETPIATHLAALASTLASESRSNARECLLEGDWKASLNGLVRTLVVESSGALKSHMSEKGKLAASADGLCCAYHVCQSGIRISSPRARRLVSCNTKTMTGRPPLAPRPRNALSSISI